MGSWKNFLWKKERFHSAGYRAQDLSIALFFNHIFLQRFFKNYILIYLIYFYKITTKRLFRNVYKNLWTLYNF